LSFFLSSWTWFWFQFAANKLAGLVKFERRAGKFDFTFLQAKLILFSHSVLSSSRHMVEFRPRIRDQRAGSCCGQIPSPPSRISAGVAVAIACSAAAGIF
jgi:hypothetical protein